MPTFDNLKRNQQLVIDIATEEGATEVAILGSVVPRNATPGSDTDILAEMEPGRSAFDLRRLLMGLQAPFCCKVDVVAKRGLNRYLRDRVIQMVMAI